LLALDYTNKAFVINFLFNTFIIGYIYFIFYNIDIDMFNLSIQANIYLGILILTGIINMISISIAAGPLGFLAYTLYAILAIPFFILYVYNIDCLTTGDCQIWSWVVAIFSSISLLITAVLAIYLTAVPPKTVNEPIIITTSTTPVVTTSTTPVVTSAVVTAK
jgi:hypothetical protein